MVNRPEKCPDCGGEIVMVQYSYHSPRHYDGISEHACMNDCGFRVGRWCGKRLQKGESEPVFCNGGKSHED